MGVQRVLRVRMGLASGGPGPSDLRSARAGEANKAAGIICAAGQTPCWCVLWPTREGTIVRLRCTVGDSHSPELQLASPRDRRLAEQGVVAMDELTSPAFQSSPLRPVDMTPGQRLRAEGVIAISASAFPVSTPLPRVEWDSLAVDRYLPCGTYRFRRFGRVKALPGPSGWSLVPLPYRSFQQPAEVIPLYNGAAREFAPIRESLLRTAGMVRLIKTDLDIVVEATGRQQGYMLGLHMIRIVAGVQNGNAPAPEGRHRDGHQYVAMHLINRIGCSGGVSRVYHGKCEQPALVTTLSHPLDTLVVNDQLMEHEVTSVLSLPGASQSVRDLLIVDFDAIALTPASGTETQ
ncbi:2OG-Fe dioxygenase family protein [Streptomyces sp. NPDC127084]|uniref:2OG-Fe dioxygenase family protein n=1 Tax=Streptomyces sp. NPDC127084 TaxID=3347133 RepID=UPI003657618A